jgi:hypothetical protein
MISMLQKTKRVMNPRPEYHAFDAMKDLGSVFIFEELHYNVRKLYKSRLYGSGFNVLGWLIPKQPISERLFFYHVNCSAYKINL